MNPQSPDFMPRYHDQSTDHWALPIDGNTESNHQSPDFPPRYHYQSTDHWALPINGNTESDALSVHDPSPIIPQYPSMKTQRVSSQTSSNSSQHVRDPAAQAQRPMLAQPKSRVDTFPLHQRLNNLQIQDMDDGSQVLDAYTRNVDKTTNPASMPIGSLAALKGPAKWGVMKISNIPYNLTKQEIFQFIGRQARPITDDMGCPIHIIMDRSTAKTMDCYVEFKTVEDAHNTVERINRTTGTGRAPRLGSRHVEVEMSDQDALLKDLFPRANCIEWESGMPKLQPNRDPIGCSGFNGFMTGEELIMAIRHAEVPSRSPFGEKCPERTYESTISTLDKFPWYAPRLYTVQDRNRIFDLSNRHILSLSSRIHQKTVGLSRKLLQELLHAGLKCPAFNERQKYTLCVNSGIELEINKLSDMAKWFPFDTLSNKPDFHDAIHKYYADLISQGTVSKTENMGLINKFPHDLPYLRSPYGSIWLEWSASADNILWEDAVEYELSILHDLVLRGWMNDDRSNMSNLQYRQTSKEVPSTRVRSGGRNLSMSFAPSNTMASQAGLSARSGAYLTPSRRASESTGTGSISGLSGLSGTWNHKLLFMSPTETRPYRDHRRTESSPMCLTPITNTFGEDITR
ncbi:uncharacterized protein DSM5745_07796 [Aspergillus mulundensis]|uniref:RRM domain-containing protein n=1 Tax=Aspergillus mulundensis TaxID=1810919 RepID=A0A3D8RFH2_9EURO|nr:Uncharacterized protein DSM5745_07796 [Aspergillus mulundensis]RDW72624.1 Uncharacterized protein DSM5745_07796 [Aspergillus mulundensis]